MDRNQIFLCLFFMIAGTSLYAQTSLGVEGGLSYNSRATNIANRAATTLTGVVGFQVGIPFRYEICPWLYAVTKPGLVQKGYSMDRTDSLSGEYDRHQNSYLQLPVGVSFVQEWGRFRGTIDPGIYTGYWLYGRVKGSTADIFSVSDNTGPGGQTSEQYLLKPYDSRYNFLSQRDERWEWGWWLGLGLQYRLDHRCRLTAGGNYYRGWTSQEKAPVSPIPSYNRTWTFSLGIQWAWRKLKSGQ
jgi:hypothetical protein